MVETLSSISAWDTRSQQIIDDARNWIRSSLSNQVHSLYLFGSFASKKAKPNLSNLDLVVVTHREDAHQFSTFLRSFEWRMSKSYPELTGIRLWSVPLSQVLSLESVFTWGFVLKQCCQCLYGDDLTHCFGDFEPNWEIAKFWNMDLEQQLPQLRQRLANANEDKAQFLAQREIAKKLLRAHYGLVLHKHKVWVDDPITCGKIAQQYYPKKKLELERLAMLLRPHLIPKRSVVGLLDSHGSWLVKAYKKTEFRIG